MEEKPKDSHCGWIAEDQFKLRSISVWARSLKSNVPSRCETVMG